MSVFLRGPDGSIYQYADKDAAAAVKAGYAPVSAAEVAAAEAAAAAKAKAGSFTGKLQTAAEAAGAGAFDVATGIPRLLTAGMSAVTGEPDLLGRVSGRQFIEDVKGVGTELLSGGDVTAEAAARQYATEARGRAKENPISATVGGIVGQVAGAAAGGLAGAARGAGTAATAAAGGGVGARLLGAGVAGALEGAPLGLAAASDQAYIEGRQLTGEQALAAGGIGALLGGGLSMGVKGAGELAGYVKGRATAKLAEVMEGGAPAATGAAPEPAVRRILRTGDAHIEKQGERVLGEATLPGFSDHVRSAVGGKNMSELRAVTHGEATEVLTKELQSSVQLANEVGEQVFNAPLKRANVAANFAKGGVADDAIERTWDLASSMLSDLNKAIASEAKPPAMLVGLRDQMVEHVKAIGKAVSPEDAYMPFDQIRRDLLSTSRAFGDSAMKTANVDRAAAMKGLAEQLGGHYETSYKHLMDTSLWGAQGAAQQRANEAAVKLIEAKRFAYPHFAEKVGEQYAGPGRFLPTFEVHDGKIASLVRKAGTPEAAFAERRFQQLVSATKEFSEAVGQSYDLPAELAGRVSALGKSTTAVKKTYDAMMQKVGALNQAETFMEAVKQGGGTQMPAILGGVMGGPVGSAAGFALGAATNPARFLSQRIALEQMAERSQKLIGSSLDGLFSRGTEAAAAPVLKVAAPRGLAAQATVPTSLAYFMGKHATPEQAYEKRVNELYHVSQNMGGGVHEAIGNAFGPIASQEREALTAMTVSAVTGVNYLLSKMPSGLYAQNTLTPLTSKTIPNRGEIQSFARTYAAVMKPSTVLDDLKAGKATPNQIEAVRTVYPRYYEDIRTATMQRIRELDQRGKTIPMRTRAMLDTLLDLNGAGERTMTTAFVQRYAPLLSDAAAMRQRREEREAKRPRPGPTKLGKATTTQTATFLGGT